MALDISFERAKALCDELRPRLPDIETEQDARFQIINRFLTEILGWNFDEIKTEPHSESGYTDYLLSAEGQRRLVVEAKRNGPLLVDTLSPQMKVYKVGGPALMSAAAGIKQAATYCLDHGVNYAILTTGVTWIAYIPMPGGGISYKDGLAFVFPDFDAVLDNFAIFYDLCSRHGVVDKTYNLHFAKAGGLSISAFEPLTAANRIDLICMLPQSQLAMDLHPVFREFFGSLSAENKEMLIECFVETRESKYADASLEKMVRSVSSAISQLEPTADNQLAQEIEAAVETGRGENVILVGNNGAGKSTFIERFFDSVLEAALRERCSVVRVNLSESTGDPETLSAWLTRQLKEKLETLLFDEGIPSYDQLQGLYWREYQRWMKGPFKPLYDSNKEAFKIKFSEYLNEQMIVDPYSYVLRMLEDIVRNRKLLPCICFDNADQFDFKYQELAFQFSQAIRESVPFTFIVTAITDRSLWQLSKAGPFQAYPAKMFYLPVPPTKAVLERRVSFLKRKVDDETNRHSYFSGKGIRLTVENIKAFAACLEEVFIREDFMSRRISWLANNNLKKSLELTQNIIVSPFFSIEDHVKAFIAYGSDHPIRLNHRAFMQALLQGQYNAFLQEHNSFVLNVFAISPYFPTTPLLNLGILKLLIDRAGEEAGVGSYISIEQITQYFVAMGISETALDHSLIVLLGYRLIEPYDASDDSVAASQRVAISHSGRMHFEMATTNSIFVGDMLFATPLRSTKVVDSLRAIRIEKMAAPQWQNAQRLFANYCFEQDAIYSNIPNDSIFEGQRQLRSDFKARWIEQRQPQTNEATSDPTGFSQREVVVKWFSVDRGYGFAEANLDTDVFFHRDILAQSGIKSVAAGDVLTCDIARGPKGRLSIIAVHSIRRRELPKSAAKSLVDGVVEFYNEKRGYGFIKAPTVREDIYLSARVLEENGVPAPSSGTKVRVAVEEGRLGKGFMASSIEIVQ